jgi:hypothetical protein
VEGFREHGNEPSAVKLLNSCTTGGFSRRAQLHEVSSTTTEFLVAFPPFESEGEMKI